MQNKQKSQNTVVRRFYSVSVSHLLMQIIQMGILFNAESDPGALGFGLRFCITNECLREADIAGPQTTRWATRRAIMPPKQLFLFVYQFSSVQFNSVAQSCPTLCDLMNRSTPGLPVHHQLPEFTQTRVHRVRGVIQPSHPQSSPSPPASSIRVFSSESTLRMRWPKYWSFSFSIISSKEIPGLISFRMDLCL